MDSPLLHRYQYIKIYIWRVQVDVVDPPSVDTVSEFIWRGVQGDDILSSILEHLRIAFAPCLSRQTLA